MMNIALFSPGSYAPFFDQLIEYSNRNKILFQDQQPKWHVLTSSNVYLDLFKESLGSDSVCYLFEKFNSYMQNDSFSVDLDFYHGSIYRDILTDKHGFFIKDSSYQVKNASVIYYVWKSFLESKNIDYMVFPDVESVEGMILLSVCGELGIKVLYYVNARNIGHSFFAKNNFEEYYKYIGVDVKSYKLVEFFLKVKNINNKARIHTLEFRQGQYDKKAQKYKRKFTRKLQIYLKNKFIFETHYLKEDMSFIVKFKSLFLGFLNKYRDSRKYIYKKYISVKTVEDITFKYVYFPLQVTPESSINNLEPYFVDQIRAIDLLLMNISSDTKIIVKEHPIMAGERSESFYKILSRKPGVEVASLDIPSQALISNSSLVSAITGTTLLEAMLQNKPVFQFGKTFFYQDAFGFDSFRNMRQDLNEIMQGKRTNDIENILSNLYPILFDFYIELPFQYYYQPEPLSFMDENLNNTIEAIDFYITNIENGNLV